MYGIVIHGGAGTIRKERMTAEKENAYQKTLQNALNTGYDLLSKKDTAIAAVEAAIKVMEDSPLFNAGKGAVFTATGGHEMDAAIMCGKSLEAGAIAAVPFVRNPIRLAKSILEVSPHILLSGEAALDFAKKEGIVLEEATYFDTPYRRRQWERSIKSNRVQLDHSDLPPDKKFGTVGAVAVDQDGNIAAATSTGGMTNKNYGRIGDSPIIGVGTYADNKSCAISCTGKGEVFMKYVVAYDVACLMEYQGLSLQAACDRVIHEKLPTKTGGLIAIDAQGNIAMPFNTLGMYRAWKKAGEEEGVAIYKE